MGFHGANERGNGCGISDVEGLMEDFAANGFADVRGRFSKSGRGTSADGTCAPSRASSSATARPSPLLAAATMATRPVSPRSILLPLANP